MQLVRKMPFVLAFCLGLFGAVPKSRKTMEPGHMVYYSRVYNKGKNHTLY